MMMSKSQLSCTGDLPDLRKREQYGKRSPQDLRKHPDPKKGVDHQVETDPMTRRGSTLDHHHIGRIVDPVHTGESASPGIADLGDGRLIDPRTITTR